MFKYTRAAVNRIVIDAKMLAHVANMVMQSLMILYLGFSVITERGSTLINGILLGLTAANLAFYLITYARAEGGIIRLRRRVSRVYVAAKLSVNLIPLASIAYSIYVGASDVTSLALILTPLMIILWVMQVAFNLARVYIESRAALFMDGVEMDIESVKGPFVGMKNRIHDFFDEEHEPTKSNVSKRNRRVLEEQAGIRDAEREEERGERRERREERRELRGEKWARRGKVFGNKVKSWFSPDDEDKK